jgi:hypothetical protein
VVIQYARDNGVTLYDMSQELKMGMDKIRHQFSYNMTPERIMKYCRAVDRIVSKRNCDAQDIAEEQTENA